MPDTIESLTRELAAERFKASNDLCDAVGGHRRKDVTAFIPDARAFVERCVKLGLAKAVLECTTINPRFLRD